MKPLIDLSGMRFGRLTAKHYSTKNDGRKAWVCVCDCGTEIEVRGAALRTGKTRSCGCFKAERMAAGLRIVHGQSHSRTHKSWDSMVQRCTNPNDPSYSRYGGRGIQVCDAWRSFEKFYRDMGDRPAGMTLDRINPKGNYEPGNCRWATNKEQQNNISSNRVVEYQGETLTARQLAERTGLPYELLRARIFRHGWDVTRAVETPVINNRKA